MFISRPSDPRTVLLWGDRWWVAGHGMVGEFSRLGEAGAVLAEHFRDEPKPVRLRLIYAPDSFRSVATACPPGNRSILAAALAPEFPALADGDLAWSHDPVLAKDGEHSTILHFETEPGLFAVGAILARAGLAVESAWPLAAYLQALQADWGGSGAFTVAAIDRQRACAYRHSGDGMRSVQHWEGESALAEAAKWLKDIPAEDPNEPVLVVSTDENVADSLRSLLGQDRPELEFASLADILGGRNLLPRYHPAQLLPTPRAFTAQRAVIAASLLCLLAAGWTGATLARDTLAARAERESREKHAAALRAENAHLRENSAEISRLRRLLEGGAAGPPCGELLERVSRTVPAELVLSSIRIHDRRFEFTGWISPSAPVGILDRWLGELAPPGGLWTASLQPGTAGAFTATGGFHP